jgi:hypothetical protein
MFCSIDFYANPIPPLNPASVDCNRNYYRSSINLFASLSPRVNKHRADYTKK